MCRLGTQCGPRLTQCGPRFTQCGPDSLSVAQAECLDVVAVGKATDAYLLVSVARDDVSVVVVVTTIAAVGADAAAAQYLTQSDTHIFYRAHHMDMHVQISTILQ